MSEIDPKAIERVAAALLPGLADPKRAREAAVQAITAYLSTVSPLSDGDGWQLVPREPTEAMIQAGLEALRTEGYTPIDRDPLFVWRSMWHAARALSGNRSGKC